MKNIIFDFGGVFINLDVNASKKEMFKLGMNSISPEMMSINKKFQKGLISSLEFLNFYQDLFPDFSSNDLIKSWNSTILDFPLYRLEFLESLKGNHQLYLISNINDLHLEYIKQKLGESFYNRFVSCFEKVYYSHEIHMAKPDKEVYQFVLQDSKIEPSETIFVDDMKENTDSAKTLGLNIWNLDPESQDVIDLYNFTSRLHI